MAPAFMAITGPYKRAMQANAKKPKPIFNVGAAQIIRRLKTMSKATNIAAVSYTHLDVYKRQAWLEHPCLAVLIVAIGSLF